MGKSESLAFFEGEEGLAMEGEREKLEGEICVSYSDVVSNHIEQPSDFCKGNVLTYSESKRKKNKLVPRLQSQAVKPCPYPSESFLPSANLHVVQWAVMQGDV